MQVNRKLITIMATSKCVWCQQAKIQKIKENFTVTKKRNGLFVAWLKLCLRYRKELNYMGDMGVVHESHHLL